MSLPYGPGKQVGSLFRGFFAPKSKNPFLFYGFPWHYEREPRNCEGVPIFGGAKAQLWRQHPQWCWDERKKMDYLLPGVKEGCILFAVYWVYGKLIGFEAEF